MKKNRVLLLVAFVAMLAGSSWAECGQTVTTHTQEKEWFSRGQAALAFGNYDEAIDCFEKVLSFNPGFSDVYRFIGDVYMKKGTPDSAIEAYKKALDSKTQAVHALVGLGNANFQKGQYGEALTAYEKALIRDPGNAAARIGLGDVYYKRGDLAGALSEYRKGLAQEPDRAEAQLKAGMIYQEKSKPDTAAQHFYKAGILFIGAGDRNNALQAYELLKQTGDASLVQLLHDALQPSME